MDRLIELINEVLEDIQLYGPCTECTVYIDRETNLITDYLVNPDKILYLDEKILKTTLFELLCNFVTFDYERNNSDISNYAVVIKCIRQLTGLSQRAFAQKYGLSRRTLESWEKMTKPDIMKVIEIAKDNNVNSSVVLNAIKGLQEN